MANKFRSPQKPLRRGTFGEGGGVYLTDELTQSLAYRVLTPSQKLILIDMIRVYMRASNFDKEDISGVGFNYTFECCQQDADERTFTDARKRICELGFFAKAPKLKSLRPGSPDVYVPSRIWREYKPSEHEMRRLKMSASRKRQKLERDATRRREFRHSLPKTQG